jgi:tRNA uridine 5-carboxymethylaminomethyl modification enzyme
MFTSRAEYRLLLREDNADVRLTPVGRELGVVDDHRWASFERRRESLIAERARLDAICLRPEDVPAAHVLAPLKREATALSLLRRPEVSHAALTELARVGASGIFDGLEPEEREQTLRSLEIDARYAGYIERQSREIERSQDAEATRLPPDLDYAAVTGLSHEVREKLTRVRPETIGQAGRVAGMTPAAISLLLVHLKKGRVARLNA